MDEEEKARAALKAIIDGDGDEKAKSRARAALAAMDEDDESNKPAASDQGGEKKDDEPAARAPAARVSASTAGAIAANANELAQRVAALEAKHEADARAMLLASRKDLAPSLVKVLETKPLAEVKAIVDSIPMPATPKPAAAAQPTVKPTLGATQVDAGGESPGASSPHAADMDRVMGIASSAGGIRREGSVMKFGVLTPAQATAHVAGKGGAR